MFPNYFGMNRDWKSITNSRKLRSSFYGDARTVFFNAALHILPPARAPPFHNTRQRHPCPCHLPPLCAIHFFYFEQEAQQRNHPLTFFPSFFNQLASFPIVVVLPTPLTPTTRIMLGPCLAKVRLASSPNNSAINS